MEEKDLSGMFLQLSPDPIRFEPVSKVTNVFFDGTTKEVVSVRGGGTLGVVVQGLHSKKAFCMEHRGNISTLKFAPDHSILAVQRTTNSLELLSFSDGEVGPGVVVECKAKNATLLGFVWADHDDLVLITNQGVEFYHVSQERVFVRLTRNYSVPNTCWFVWSSECHLLVVASTSPSTGHMVLYPFQFAPNYSNKLQKCLVDLQCADTGVLQERDVCVVFVYKPSILVLRHPPSAESKLKSSQLLVHTLTKDSSSFKLTHICQLEMTGSFAINVIDSLVIVHHQSSKVSMVFDIALGSEIRDGVCYVYPATKPASIRPYYLEEPVNRSRAGANTITKVPCQLYAPTWVVFQPFVIIDALLGCLWTLQLDLQSFSSTFSDSVQLIKCLLNRKQAKSLILQSLCTVTERKALYSLGSTFDWVNAAYRRHLDSVTPAQSVSSLCTPTNGLLVASPTPRNSLHPLPPSAVVESVDMYKSVLSPLMEKAYTAEEAELVNEGVSYLVSVTLEYVRSLLSCGIPVPDFLHKLVVNALLNTHNFFHLHQLLQYHIIPDSKPLACTLLSRAGVYPACEQLSLDMLSRLHTADEEIIEVLLANRQVTLAIRYARANGLEESLSCRKFLDAAMKSEDKGVFYSTFIYFTLRYNRLGTGRRIGEGDYCDGYVKFFKKHFGALPDSLTSNSN